MGCNAMRITEKKLRRIIGQELQGSRLNETTVKLDTFNLQDPKLQRLIRDRGIDYDVLGQKNPGIDFVKSTSGTCATPRT